MDPCPFIRIVIGGLAVKLPISSKSATSATFFCKIKLKDSPTQTSAIPLSLSQEDEQIPNLPLACFNLNKSQLEKLSPKSSIERRPSCLKIEIYKGCKSNLCGLRSGKLLGSVTVPLDLKTGENRALVLKNGWVSLGAKETSSARLHLNVKVEPDPRFVFRFDGEPECSPQVFQVNGNLKQPVFTCKFSFRSSCDPNLRSRSSLSEESTSKTWLNSLKNINNKEQQNSAKKERKGWSITIHDLSGSPVAAASMVTPFVPSPGTDRVSRSNPGAWLILRPGDSTWKPWGRLEAWLEPSSDLGFRFDLLPDAVSACCGSPVTLTNSTLSTKNGGKFVIDVNTGSSPASSRSSSCDFGSGSLFGSGSWADLLYRGFVMSSTVEGNGKCSEPEVEVGVGHVSCAEDAAAFVALAAAMDLSMDACRPFCRRLRKELRRQQSQEFVL